MVLFGLYLFSVAKMTLFRMAQPGYAAVNLIPFRQISEYMGFIVNGYRSVGIYNLLGNVVLLLPLGYLCALLFPKTRGWLNIATISFCVSWSIEFAQYITARGQADVDDLILNALGGIIGYSIFVYTSKKPRRSWRAAPVRAIVTGGVAAMTLIIVFSGFFGVRSLRLRDNPMMTRARVMSGTRGAPGVMDAPGTRGVPGAMGAPGSMSVPGTMDAPGTRGAPGRLLALDDNASELRHDPLNPATPVDQAGTPWFLILINESNPLPDDYPLELYKLSNGQSVDIRIYDALMDMLDAAKSDGINAVVSSGYRSRDDQRKLLDEKIAAHVASGMTSREAASAAQGWVAAPGASEHHSGLAVDINADGVGSAGHEVYAWLNANAYKYGFILRYPPGKSAITGIYNEPWHYRFVGAEAAADINEKGYCLEEYLLSLAD